MYLKIKFSGGVKQEIIFPMRNTFLSSVSTIMQKMSFLAGHYRMLILATMVQCFA